MKKKIIDNPSTKKILEQMSAFEWLEAFAKAMPALGGLLPDAESSFAALRELKEKSAMIFVPDQFNASFSEAGWIAYESMSLDAMVNAIATLKAEGLSTAEDELAAHYGEDTLSYGIMRFHGHPDFRKRLRLIELAKDDYLAGRYHACIPLLLALLDGLVNDVSRHVGFFSEGVDLTAWDSIAAHESGLSSLAKIMGVGRNKTSEEPLSIPFRNGILHGRELAFDNRVVAAKCWAAMFAVRDWADALRRPKPASDLNASADLLEALEQLAQTRRTRAAFEAWLPRDPKAMDHLPSEGPSRDLPQGSPERFAAAFLEHWAARRYGPMSQMLVDYLDRPSGKLAGIAKRDFGNCTLLGHCLVEVADENAATSVVKAQLRVQRAGQDSTAVVSIRLVYNDVDHHPVLRGSPAGAWKIVQNGFAKLLFPASA